LLQFFTALFIHSQAVLIIISTLFFLIIFSALAPLITLPFMLVIRRNEHYLKATTLCFTNWKKLYLTFFLLLLISTLILLITIASLLPILSNSPLQSVMQFHNDQLVFQQIAWTANILRDLFYMTGVLFSGLTILSFISLFTMFSLPLIVEKKVNPMRAICMSCKLISKAWIRLSILFFFYLPLAWIALQIPAYFSPYGWIVTLAGMIWLLPFCFTLYSECYRSLSGTN
ncbi:MAG: hypothetical protein KDH94_01125, partial [Coxiellaceae bacterium]|nr:hypothetical protein [Coxiellaceae bacterium]